MIAFAGHAILLTLRSSLHRPPAMASITHRKSGVKVTRSSIRRAVASSTAIETGQDVKVLEQKLKRGKPRIRRVSLAAAKAR